MPLDVTAFRRAIGQCDDALALAASAGVRDDARLTLHMRAAPIQAFEFTYELSVKMLKRYLQQSEADPGFVDTLDFRSLIRKGYEIGLLRSEWSV